MDELFIKNQTERNFYNSIKEMSDRELQELQASYLFESNKNIKRIKDNVIFWFYTALLVAVLAIILNASK